MGTLLTGANAVVDEILSYQKVTVIKNHYYAAVGPADATSGVIWIDSDDGITYRRYAAAWNAIGTTPDFQDGGEAGGAARSLGNTDAEILSFITNNVDGIIISAAGEVTKPLSPCFSAYGATGTNVTGDGTTYTITFPNGIFDLGGDFASPTFTSPIMGKYLLMFQVKISDINASHLNAELQIVTSNRTYKEGNLLNPANGRSAGNEMILTMMVIADMDAADTAHVTVRVYNNTKTVEVLGGEEVTFFCGSLLN